MHLYHENIPKNEALKKNPKIKSSGSLIFSGFMDHKRLQIREICEYFRPPLKTLRTGCFNRAKMNIICFNMHSRKRVSTEASSRSVPCLHPWVCSQSATKKINAASGLADRMSSNIV